MILGVLVEMDQRQSEVSDQDLDAQIETYFKKEIPAAKVLFRRTPDIYEEQALQVLQKILIYEHHYPMVTILSIFSDLMSLGCPEMMHHARTVQLETRLNQTLDSLELEMTPNQQGKGYGVFGEDWCKVITELHPC